ncbi:MAG: hypothetical protein NTX57_09705 [Armatimonadetes bacterium]|nr:hypothetical protein [Armatimonadota bacterium]
MPERRFYLLLGALALTLASGPYLYGWLNTPPGSLYSGLTSNIDDCLVYFSWMREAGRGHVLHHNLFSTEAQSPKLLYVWFVVLGVLAKAIGLPLAFHLGRILGGAALLRAVVWLLQETIQSERARKLAFALVCFSSGFGWLSGGYNPAKGFTSQPIDTFQPEAITFLSLYYSPLFAPMTALMVVFFASLLKSERTRKLPDLWPACAAGAILGNSHTYDVVHLLAVAWVYKLFTLLPGPPPDNGRRGIVGWKGLLLATAACLPTTAYTAWASRVDPLFKARAWTNEGTFTPALWWVLLGFGLPLLLALLPLLPRYRGAGGPKLRFLFVWLLLGIAVAYLPVPFQRKMLMGAHIPVCLLAGVGLDALTARLSGDFPKIAALFGVLLTVPSNVLYLLADIGRLDSNSGTTARKPYLSADDQKALAYLREHATETDAVLVSPDPDSLKRYPGMFEPHLNAYVAGWAGVICYNGHWSETLAYPKKNGAALRFFRSDTDDETRRQLLSESHIRYMVLVNRLAGFQVEGYSAADGTLAPPVFLKAVYTGSELTIFEVSL